MTDSISLAVFGETGSGKSSLLTRFHGHHYEALNQPAEHYRLLGRTTGSRPEDIHARLLADYVQLKNLQQFPRGSTDYIAARYLARAQVSAMDTTDVLSLCWHDYPGGWWTTDAGDKDERKVRSVAFGRLIGSQIGILLFDGERLAKDASYAPKLVDRFTEALNTARTGFLKMSRDLPSEWIFAISKADSLPPRLDARSFGESLFASSYDKLQAMRRTLGESRIGTQVLLLSAVPSQRRGHGGQCVGIDALLPVALQSFFAHTARRRQADLLGRAGGYGADLLEGVANGAIGLARFADGIPLVNGVEKMADALLSMLGIKAALRGTQRALGKRRERLDLEVTAIRSCLNQMVASIDAATTANVFHRMELMVGDV